MDLDVEYDNRGRVPEHPAVVEGWVRDAAAFRAEARADLDIPYGPSERQKLDIFLPEGEPVAAAMFIHGGYWQSLDKSMVSHMARGLVAHGFAVAVPGYDLCPQVRISDIVEEIASACLVAAQRLGMPIVVAGHSAGGHLAAAMLARDWSGVRAQLGFDPVPAAFPISGLFDLPPLIATRVNNAVRMDLAEATAQSPVLATPPRGKRLVAIVGGDESAEYHRQSRELCEIWGKGGVETTLDIVAGANHFTIIGPLADPASKAVAQIRELAGR